jgi:aromatic ring-opening dioxygenase LigB subunit
VTVVFGAIAPHGDPAFVEGSVTRLAFQELGSRAARAAPEVTVVFTPHNVHVEGAFAVLTAATLAGSLEELPIEFECRVDRGLAREMVDALRSEGIPAVSVSYGSNDETLAVMPLDWGALIPLWFLGGGDEEPHRPVVVVSPARDLPLADHMRAGAVIAHACANRSVAVVASADHGHAHDPDGPFGFDPASAEYDARVVDLVRANRLENLPELEPIVTAASADSLWQMVMLHGVLGDDFDAELLSYERPTYFGMLCAAFEPCSSAA